MGTPEGRPEGHKPIIIDILEKHGRKEAEKLPVGFSIGKSTRVGAFLDATNFSMDSPFGHFTVLIEGANLLASDIRNTFRQGTRGGKQEITASAKKQIIGMQSLLATIHEVRKEIGWEIFGDATEEYTKKVKERLERGPVGTSMAAIERRKQWYAELGEEVRGLYPKAEEQ